MYEVEQDGGIDEKEKAREQDDTDKLEWNKRVDAIVRDRKLYRYKETGILKRMQKQAVGKFKKKMPTENKKKLRIKRLKLRAVIKKRILT